MYIYGQNVDLFHIAHPHGRLRTPILDSLPNTPILFTQSTQLDAIFNKLNTFMQQQQTGVTQNDLESLKTALKAKYESNQSGPLQLPSNWTATISALLKTLSTEHLFPILDILRLLILDERVMSHYMTDAEATLMSILYRFGGQVSNPETIPKAVRLMVVRIACNHFTSPAATAYLLSLSRTLPPHDTPFRSVTSALLIESLLSADAAVRHCAASLAFNIALEEAKSRQSNAGVEAGKEDEGIHEEWISELVAAVAKALEEEDEDEIVLRLLTALGHLLRFSTPSIQQLAAVIGVTTAVDKKRITREQQSTNSTSATDEQTKKEIERRNKIIGLCKEVVTLVGEGADA